MSGQFLTLALLVVFFGWGLFGVMLCFHVASLIRPAENLYSDETELYSDELDLKFVKICVCGFFVCSVLLVAIYFAAKTGTA